MMPAARPAPIVERRSLATRRYAAKPDDLAELRLVIATMRDVPREALESFPDMIHLLRRLSGRLDGIAGRLGVEEPKSAKRPRMRLSARPAPDPAAIAAGVFKTKPRSAGNSAQSRSAPRRPRDKVRTVMSRKGRAVRVVERPSAQLELTV